MLVLYDPTTLLHKTVEVIGATLIDALESPERVQAILDAIKEDKTHSIVTLDTTSYFDSRDGTIKNTLFNKLILESHDPEYLEHLRTIHAEWVALGNIEVTGNVLPECFPVRGVAGGLAPRKPKDGFARPGYFAFDMSSGIAKETWRAACASANLAVEAVRRASEGENHDIFALCRPPGHHCTTKLAGGYCYLNNIVVAVHAVRHFFPEDASKIAILDLDFHHGNGTQASFYDDPTVLYVSIHGDGEFPYYSGDPAEDGAGPGAGCNVNLPLAVRATFDEYLEQLESAMLHLQAYGPTFLLVSLGFDTFHLDPLGAFDLWTEHYETIAATVRKSLQLRDIPSVILLEGGYVLEDLGKNTLSFLRGWESVY